MWNLLVLNKVNSIMVTPCINNIQHFNNQLTHTTSKKRRVIKTFLLTLKCFNNSTFFLTLCASVGN